MPLTENSPHVDHVPRQLLDPMIDPIRDELIQLGPDGGTPSEIESGLDLNSEPMLDDPMNTPQNPGEELPFGPDGVTPGEDPHEVESGFNIISGPILDPPPEYSEYPDEEIPFGLLDP